MLHNSIATSSVFNSFSFDEFKASKTELNPVIAAAQPIKPMLVLFTVGGILNSSIR
jgi:hypothetical protein